MNKKVIIIAAFVLAVVLAVLLVIFLPKASSEGDTKDKDNKQNVENTADDPAEEYGEDYIAMGSLIEPDAVFAQFTSKSEVEKFVEENYVEEDEKENYLFEDNIFYTHSTEFLGANADVTVEFAEDDSVRHVKAEYRIFAPGVEFGEVVAEGEGSVDASPEDEEVSEVVEGTPYEFTSADKGKIMTDFGTIKASIETQLGCKLEQYDALPTGVSPTFEDTDEDFFKGYYIREYTIKDRNGEMWRIVFEASFGTSSAKVERFCKEEDAPTAFPIIDLTKN